MSGTPRPTISTAQSQLDTVDTATLVEARESSLYGDPRWLRATDHALPGVHPFHTVARRRPDEYAVLPAYLITDPPLPDVDPRTYLDDRAEPGACCGASRGTTGLPGEQLLPAVVIGSPMGFHSEPFFTFWNERLLHEMTTATVQAAREAGAKAVLAPWMGQRLTGMDLAGELRRAGAVEAFWGCDEYIELTATSLETHLARATRAQRFRMRADRRQAAASATLRVVTGAELKQLLPQLSDLVADTYHRQGTNMPAAAVHDAITALQSSVDVYAACAFSKTDGQLSAGHILVHRHPRLYGKWFGQASEAARTGVYFALLAAEPLALGYQLGVRYLELGAGSYQAKRLRGSTSRRKSTSLLVFDPAVHAACTPRLTEFGRRRGTAQLTATDPAVLDTAEAHPPTSPLPLVASTSTSSSCCSS